MRLMLLRDDRSVTRTTNSPLAGPWKELEWSIHKLPDRRAALLGLRECIDRWTAPKERPVRRKG